MKKTKPTSTPLVSVVMSAYNAERYIKEAIDSILNQTFTDFEFIIINDGSTDGTLKIIKSYKDPRIVLISRANKGLVASLNEGIKKARGKYIARMDADDISLPERFTKQVDVLEKENAVLVSSAFGMFVDDPAALADKQCLINNNAILKRELLFRNPFAHGATMYRRDTIIKIGLYSNIKYTEDVDLWMRLAEEGSFSYISEVCYLWRINPDGITQTRSDAQRKNLRLLTKKYQNSQKTYIYIDDIDAIMDEIGRLPSDLRKVCLARVLDDQKYLVGLALGKMKIIRAIKEINIYRVLKRMIKP